MNKIILTILAIALLVSGCAGKKQEEKNIFRYGTTAYGASMDNAGINPHKNYQGWSAIRYGVGETLFRLDMQLQPQPWLACKYEQLDSKTWKITLRDNILFSSGRKLTAAAVKECLENLLHTHNRAASDLKLSSIETAGQELILQTAEPLPALINYLCDPYACIIDMQAISAGKDIVSGTGPFIAEHVTPNEILLQKNPHYWNGTVQTDTVLIKSIPDGDTLTMALQSGEIDAAQGLPYASLKLFRDNPSFKISSTDTSRVFQAALNYGSPLLQDDKVRAAIALAIDKKQFCQTLLDGNGTPAAGPFPANLPYGNTFDAADNYNPARARQLLQEAGWYDSNGDGYVEKNGQPLTLRWLTYPARQELPLLAEAAHEYLKNIGIRAEINITDNYSTFLQKGQWDIFANAFVSAPAGDPQYYFTTFAASASPYNYGHYHNQLAEDTLHKLSQEQENSRRSLLTQQLRQILADDNAYLYYSHLKMSLVMQHNISGLSAHPSDYYEITAALVKEKL